MASSSFCHVTEIQHDVFISFRGTDVRRGLLSHLIKELRREQIDVYVDEELERGDEISSSLLRAIEGSYVLLVIFSKDYASSKMCLKELVKMIECMERNKQIVLPVFYNVDPSDVGHQKGDYRDALAKHEGKFEEYMVENWRSALKKAAELSGFHYPTKFENESDLVDEIVKDVSKKLSKFYSSKSNGPSESNDLVGIDQNIAQIESLLAMKSEEALMIGIWGMGGIGKTTIARAIFDKYSLHYDGCSFLRIREEIEKSHLNCVREKLLFELFGGKNLHTDGISKARFLSSDVKRRLSRKKVFIVLDDVNTSEQLKHLVGNLSFGSGSRVIITSRDRKVLISGGVYRIHEVKELNSQESLKLFCLKAFNESQPKIGYEELSKKAIVNAKGNPLALEVLGLDFHSRSKDTWECAIRRLKKYPNEKIQSVLRFSYDGLHDIEKKAFLDIAFVFKGDDKDYVIRQLDAWDFYGSSGIEVLQQKALITISKDNRIEMHDLIQEMAQKIVCEESPNPRRRSRLILRDKEEVYDVLKNKRENDAVEAMLMDLSQIGDVPLTVDTFRKMPNLRFLKFYCPWHVDLFMPPSHVIELLRGVQDFVNLKTTDLSRSKQLVELPQFPKMSILECANLNNCHSLHDLVNLKTIDFSRSKQLMELPDLSETSNLEREYLLECESLCDGHPSMLSLQPQVTSVLSGCKQLMSFGSEIHIKSLDYLLIDGCSGPKEFSVSSKARRQLNLTDTGVEILNSSIGHLSNLECSDMDGLQFKNLPNELFCLRSTYYLRLSKRGGQDTGKPKLHILFDGLRYSRRVSLNELYNLLTLAVPQNISVFSWSCDLRLDGSNIQSLSESIQHLLRLHILSLRYCSGLLSLPELPPSIEFLDLSHCTSLRAVHGILNLPKLSKLVLVNCPSLGRFMPVEKIPEYKTTCISLDLPRLTNCGRFGSLPELLPSVEYLYFRCCTSMRTEVGDLSEVKLLNTLRRGNLPDTDELSLLTSLTVLHIFNCRLVIEKQKLHIVFDGLRSLKTLYLVDCCYLSELPDNISVLSQLCELRLDRSSVERLPESIKHLPGLKILSLWGCRRLQSLPELPSSIQILDALDCILLETVVFSLTTAGPPELQYAYISFQNCLNLVAEEFNDSFHQYARTLAHGYKLRSTKTRAQAWKYSSVSPFRFCYPESSVPEWFTYRTMGASITIELAPPSNDLFSCLLCVVLSPSRFPIFGDIKCQSYLEDGNMPRYATVEHFQHRIWMDLNSDHVYISYSDYCCRLLREIKEGEANDQCTSFSYNSKVTFEFSFEGEHELEELIKECGVCPLYLSDYHNFNKTERQRDVFELETTDIENGSGSTSDQEPLLQRN